MQKKTVGGTECVACMDVPAMFLIKFKVFLSKGGMKMEPTNPLFQ